MQKTHEGVEQLVANYDAVVQMMNQKFIAIDNAITSLEQQKKAR